MDHERYPYYFSEPGAQPRELGLGEALATLGKGAWSVMTRVASHVLGAEPKTAR